LFVFSDKLETSASADMLERRNLQQSGQPGCSDAEEDLVPGHSHPNLWPRGQKGSGPFPSRHRGSAGQGRYMAAASLPQDGSGRLEQWRASPAACAQQSLPFKGVLAVLPCKRNCFCCGIMNS